MESLKNNEIKSEQPEIGLKSLDKSVENGGRIVTFTEDFSVATFLVVAYLIETIVQIVLIVNCYRSLLILSATSSGPNWLWILFISWIVTSLLVTLLSIIWTVRGMDFEDRVCGQLLCYLMHLLLLGLVWRYLKIALAYEKADVEEFCKLRKLQIYIQAFPLLAIHFAYLINSTSQSQSYAESTLGWLIVVECCSSIISLAHQPLLMKMRKNESLDKPTSDHNHKHKPQLTSAQGVEINVTISRILFLISRVIVVGLLVSFYSFWPMLVIVAHLLTVFMWTCLTPIIFNAQTNHSSTNINNKCNAKNKVDVESSEWLGQDLGGRCTNNLNSITSWERNDFGRHVKNSLVSSYALFWDVSVNVQMNSSGLNMWWWFSLPVFLVLVENVGVLIFHLRQCPTTILFVIVSGTCLSFGILLVIVMTTWNKWELLIQTPDKDLRNETQESVMKEDEMNEKLSKFLTKSVILDFENCCQEEKMMAFHQNLGTGSNPPTPTISNVQISNLGTSDGTNTYNYRRINETLMTAVKMGQRRGDGNPKLMNNENEMESHSFTNIPQNTLSSTSSRNTNTISNLTLPNSPELQKSKSKSTRTHKIYPCSKSPLVIRKASKVQLNLQKGQQSCILLKSQSRAHPHHSAQMGISVRGRCPVDTCAHPTSDNDIYEKLIEDAYGILICEDEESSKNQNQSRSGIKKDIIIRRDAHSTSEVGTGFNKKLRVLCAKCLGNHDPLLSNCCLDSDGDGEQNIRPQNHSNLLRLNNKLAPNQQMLLYIPRPFESPKMCSETTEYPTDTEFTTNLYDNEEQDGMSNSSHFSTVHRVTYVNLPVQSQSTPINNILTSSTSSATLFPSADVRKEFTGLEYVRAWLLMNDVTAKNMLNIKNNIRTNSLNRGTGNCLNNTNKVSNKSKHILKPRPNSTLLGNPYRKSQPVFVQFKPPPMQKQHPDLKNFCSPINNNTSINHCHQSITQSQTISKPNADVCSNKISVFTIGGSNQFQSTPTTALKVFNELRNDLIETVV